MIVSISKQHGFSLLEVLISLIILAVGLLGIAALQARAVRDNHSALLRSTAINQINNMIDRMQSNYAGVNAGAYNNVSGIGSLINCTTCSSTQIAQRDIYQWNTNNAQLLPSGTGTVTRNGQRFTITLFWDNDRTGATGTNCSGNTNVDLTCLRMEVEL
ncbi:pre-pilin leader sequence (pilV) [Legionella busanensis]|uniref:Pre-pilin leader sequence (PilV) n=1 Tax=Legionella busanensis TaxID=190655 RepID=A0A378JJ16_9GAMM|nr:type IV pilus modification protein PilV [Legionella busanensis]STX50688.1 pre-pilin leader sequence (pilV) [Legionella busanensis]